MRKRHLLLVFYWISLNSQAVTYTTSQTFSNGSTTNQIIMDGANIDLTLYNYSITVSSGSNAVGLGVAPGTEFNKVVNIDSLSSIRSTNAIGIHSQDGNGQSERYHIYNAGRIQGNTYSINLQEGRSGHRIVNSGVIQGNIRTGRGYFGGSGDQRMYIMMNGTNPIFNGSLQHDGPQLDFSVGYIHNLVEADILNVSATTPTTFETQGSYTNIDVILVGKNSLFTVNHPIVIHPETRYGNHKAIYLEQDGEMVVNSSITTPYTLTCFNGGILTLNPGGSLASYNISNFNAGTNGTVNFNTVFNQSVTVTNQIDSTLNLNVADAIGNNVTLATNGKLNINANWSPSTSVELLSQSQVTIANGAQYNSAALAGFNISGNATLNVYGTLSHPTNTPVDVLLANGTFNYNVDGGVVTAPHYIFFTNNSPASPGDVIINLAMSNGATAQTDEMVLNENLFGAAANPVNHTLNLTITDSSTLTGALNMNLFAGGGKTSIIGNSSIAASTSGGQSILSTKNGTVAISGNANGNPTVAGSIELGTLGSIGTGQFIVGDTVDATNFSFSGLLAHSTGGIIIGNPATSSGAAVFTVYGNGTDDNFYNIAGDIFISRGSTFNFNAGTVINSCICSTEFGSGGGTLNISGNYNFVGDINLDGGVVNLNSGGQILSATLVEGAGKFTINTDHEPLYIIDVAEFEVNNSAVTISRSVATISPFTLSNSVVVIASGSFVSSSNGYDLKNGSILSFQAGADFTRGSLVGSGSTSTVAIGADVNYTTPGTINGPLNINNSGTFMTTGTNITVDSITNSNIMAFVANTNNTISSTVTNSGAITFGTGAKLVASSGNYIAQNSSTQNISSNVKLECSELVDDAGAAWNINGPAIVKIANPSTLRGTYTFDLNNLTNYGKLTFFNNPITIASSAKLIVSSSLSATGEYSFTLIKAPSGISTSATITLPDDNFFNKWQIQENGTEIKLLLTANQFKNYIDNAPENAISVANLLDTFNTSNQDAQLTSLLTLLESVPTSNLSSTLSQLAPKLDIEITQNDISHKSFATINKHLIAKNDFANDSYYAGDINFATQIWLRPYGIKAAQSQTTRSSPYKFSAVGLVIGADVDLNDKYLVGIALGYNQGNTKYDEGSNVDTKSYQLNLYGKIVNNDYYYNWVAMYGHNNSNSKRNVNYSGTIVTSYADIDSDILAFDFEVNKNWDLDSGIRFLPVYKSTYIHQQTKSYSEYGGGGQDLMVNNRETQVLTLAGGFRVLLPIVKDINLLGYQELSILAGYDVISNYSPITAQFKFSSTSFKTSLSNERLMLNLGYEYTYQTQDNFNIAFGYALEARKSYTAHDISVKFLYGGY